MTRRALVIGGSIAGLFTARFLQQSGWDVLVCERNGEELASRGAGIVTHPELLDLLHQAGAGREADIGIAIERRRMIGRSGEVLEEIRLPQVVTSWDRLFRLLRARVPAATYLLGKALVGIERTDAAVTATFADGSVESADLLVGADGIWSTVRQCLTSVARPAYAGYVAWRGLVEEASLSRRTHETCFESFAIELTGKSQILGYPVTGEGEMIAAGRRRYNFVWYRPADPDGELPRLLTDRTGRRHELSIPPPLIDPQVIDGVRRDAATELSPVFAEIVGAAERPFLQPIFDLEVPRMVFGRVAILGDAAFVARPHPGAGVTKAGQDAAELAAALQTDDDIHPALERFDRARRVAGKIIVERARVMGASLAGRAPPWRPDSPHAFLEDSHAVLRETATLDFLRTGAASPWERDDRWTIPT